MQLKNLEKLQNNRFQSKLRNLKVTDTRTYWKLINGKPAVKVNREYQIWSNTLEI